MFTFSFIVGLICFCDKGFDNTGLCVENGTNGFAQECIGGTCVIGTIGGDTAIVAYCSFRPEYERMCRGMDRFCCSVDYCNSDQNYSMFTASQSSTRVVVTPTSYDASSTNSLPEITSSTSAVITESSVGKFIISSLCAMECVIVTNLMRLPVITRLLLTITEISDLIMYQV